MNVNVSIVYWPAHGLALTRSSLVMTLSAG